VNLRPGQRLRSTTCATELVIVRANGDPLELCCGGAPMVDHADTSAPSVPLDPAHSDGTRVGKRYAVGAEVEVLVTKPGHGSLSVGGIAMSEKNAKQLPSSD
jgi:hypothetical protein